MCIVEEYYSLNLMEEVFIVLGELPIPQSHLQEILKVRDWFDLHLNGLCLFFTILVPDHWISGED